jgi:hypothetical protein
MFTGRTVQASALALTLAGTLIGTSRITADQLGELPTYSQTLADLNVALGSADVGKFQIDTAELSVTRGGLETATTLIANNRTHRLSSQFVASDPRRGGLADLSYLVDQSDGSALGFDAAGTAVILLPNAVTEPVIDRSIHRWGNSTQCPSPALTKIADDGSDPDLVDGLVFGDASRIGTPRADITQAGWLGASFFNALTPNGAQFILGVTFTFVFTDDEGNPTDIDGDGQSDVAFREIYYNRAFPWTAAQVARNFEVDIDSVATHESGHALGLGHFGKVFLDNKGNLKFAPRAVMNAVYASTFFEPAGTDNASYCSVWASRK